MKHCSFATARAESQFREITQDLSRFPISFSFGSRSFKGFPAEFFPVSAHTCRQEALREHHFFVMHPNNSLEVILECSLYKGFATFEYRVFFRATGNLPESFVLHDLYAADIRFEGENPVLRGILGDHVNDYTPYCYNLEENPVTFRNDLGRSCHITFPYFNLQHGNGGTLTAIGWAGTWNASFSKEGSAIRYCGTGTNDLCTTLKIGETVRTPLMAFMCYDGRDEQEALNLWRRWYFACTAPRESGSSNRPLQPFSTVGLMGDTGRPNSDGSISEGWDSWKPSMEALYGHGLRPDFRWIDAGWYYDAAGNTVPTDWWGTVGTWDLDKDKWPGNSLKESVEYAEQYNTRTLMWFEPERVTLIKDLCENHGFKMDWVLTGSSELANEGCRKCTHPCHKLDGDTTLADLGRPGCVEWLLKRILRTLDENGIHMYREDFNCDPAPIWKIADEQQGENRRGITENLYVQGHWRLWDEIIAYAARTGKCTFVDSCASGGGRNDLETQRRGIPLLRSDKDRTTTALRLSMTTSLMHWVPVCGATAKESKEELEAGKIDTYIFRASYLPIFNTAYEYSRDKTLDWDLILASENEWKRVKDYLYGDFYVLTPWHDQNTLDQWTAFMYVEERMNGALLQAFRQEEAPEADITLQLRGLCDNAEYSIEDPDGLNGVERVSGKQLAEGFTIHLDQPRSAALLYIRKI